MPFSKNLKDNAWSISAKILEILLFKLVQDTIFYNNILGTKTMKSSKVQKDYYTTLGLKPDASSDDIDKAYKKLSTQWHPDKHKTNRKEAETKFHDICQAYDVLSHRSRRSHYDEINHRQYTNDDADKTFQRFFEQHGMEDQNEKKFFEQHYPDRRRNYYEILGVSRNATMDDIKKAYRKLSLQYHPKNNVGKQQEARKKFNEVNQAYNSLSNGFNRHNYDMISFGQIAPRTAHNVFSDFWGNRWNELDQLDQCFRPVLRNKWSRNLDKALNDGWNEDWSNVKDGQSYKTQTYYTNKNGVQSKKSITSKTKYENGVPITQTTEEYEFPDGNKQVRRIKDDGRGNVDSKVYNLKKGENLPIGN